MELTSILFFYRHGSWPLGHVDQNKFVPLTESVTQKKDGTRVPGLGLNNPCIERSLLQCFWHGTCLVLLV